MKTTLVIDMSSVTYALLPSMTELWERLTETVDSPTRRLLWDKVLRAQLRLLFTGKFLEGYLDGLEQPYNIIAVYDQKDSKQEYWRHSWLRGLELPPRKLTRRKRVFDGLGDKVGKLVSELPSKPIAYKGGRNYAENGLQRLKEGVAEQMKGMPVHQLRKTGYEADDLMATLVVLNNTLPEGERQQLVLCCNDSDIIGLVQDGVMWFDLPRRHYPIVRGNLEDINHWRVEVKKSAPLEKPSDLWLEKAVLGDVSDNLPPTGEAMLTLPAIDLLNPVAEHRLWEREEVREQVLTALMNTANIRDVGQVTRVAMKVMSLAKVTPVFYNDSKYNNIPLRNSNV